MCIPSANCVKRKLPAIVEHNNVLEYTKLKMQMQMLEGCSFQCLIKSVTAEVKKVENAVAETL